LTEEIPLQLKVENLGGKASQNTKLYLVHSDNLEMIAQYQKEEKPTWNAPNEPMKQLGPAIENINPGETYLIPVKIRFRLPTEIQRKLGQPPTDPNDPLPVGYKIYCDLSSDTAPNTRTVLEVLLGRCEILQQRSEDVFWVGHNAQGKDVQVLKVKEDYPCH
jgi:hypothetical protein